MDTQQLPLVCLRNVQLLPGTVLRMVAVDERVRQALATALARPDHQAAVFAQRHAAISEALPPLFQVGTRATVVQEDSPNATLQVLLEGGERLTLQDCHDTPEGVQACVSALAPPTADDPEEVAVLRAGVLEAARRLSSLRAATLAWEPLQACRPLELVYRLAAAFSLSLERCQALLEAETERKALAEVLEYLTHDAKLEKLRLKIEREANAELAHGERTKVLQEQARSIQHELGESTPEETDAAKLRQQLDGADLPPTVRREAERELAALARLVSTAAEYGPTRSHLELVLELPWQRHSADTHDLARARTILDEDHHGLADVKERILEYLAVMQLNPLAHAPILCLVGPPGTGKTSLGESIARALGRRFERISLGGMHDEGELRGHRRTYVSAMPGRVIAAVRKAGTSNPVLMLDELDKLGQDSFQGDPTAALMEILDPSENDVFHDNYLDLPFDLSHVFFLATANTLDTLPRALLDRLEVISLSGYTSEEKLVIAKRYLLPRALLDAGLAEGALPLSDPQLAHIITAYTREAGVRQLARSLARLCRRLALRQAQSGDATPLVPSDAELNQLLGRPLFRPEVARHDLPVGVAASVGWSESGGDVLYVEVLPLPSGTGLTLTGHLGEIMQESARAAHSLVLARGWGKERPLHIHFPAGAVAKDGPSAGAALVVALASALSDRPARADTAITGEITLTGMLLPVGGVKVKALAALRCGLRRLILPRDNEADLEELPPEAAAQLETVLVKDVDELLREALQRS